MLAVSGPVLDRAVVENPGLGPVARLSGYPINWSLLSAPASAARSPGRLTIGFVGRLHHEKGLDLLASAIEKLAEVRDLPPWHVLLCGPSDIALGGGGPGYQQRLYRRFSAVLPSERFLIPPAVFSEQALAQIYGQVDVFCYPSLAGQGETFGVAVAEAMASGAVPVVSGLAVFRDLVIPEQSGLIFDHTAPDAADQLASALARLLRDGALRGRLAEQARALTKVYDYPAFASRLLEDFQALNVRPEK
jgi:glycosyltransferase involved in cell wall biosynthesis